MDREELHRRQAIAGDPVLEEGAAEAVAAGAEEAVAAGAVVAAAVVEAGAREEVGQLS
jgi:hypothetical protein